MGRAMARGLGAVSGVVCCGVGVVSGALVLFVVVSPVVLVLVLLLVLRRRWTRGPGKRMVAAPMRTKVPVPGLVPVLLVVGAWERGAASERVAVVVLLAGGR